MAPSPHIIIDHYADVTPPSDPYPPYHRLPGGLHPLHHPLLICGAASAAAAGGGLQRAFTCMERVPARRGGPLILQSGRAAPADGRAMLLRRSAAADAAAAAVAVAARLAKRPAGRVSLALVTVYVIFVVQQHSDSYDPLLESRCFSSSHPLSLLSLADGSSRAGRPSPTTVRACLRRRRVSQVLFIGHSRLRQVFERMSARLALPPVTRSNASRVILSAAPFRDLPLQPGWKNFTLADSTCLEVWPKPDPYGDLPPRAWCSLAASAPGLTLEFRWRYALGGFLSTLGELSAACAAGDCVNVLLITQGLHYLVAGSFSTTSSVYAQTLRQVAALLRPMTARGTRVVWMLEQASNTRNRHGAEGMNDDVTVLAPLARETLLELDRNGVWVWSSHLEIVTKFLSRSCQAKMYESPGDFEVCNEEIYHVNERSLDRMSDEVLNFMCAC